MLVNTSFVTFENSPKKIPHDLDTFTSSCIQQVFTFNLISIRTHFLKICHLNSVTLKVPCINKIKPLPTKSPNTILLKYYINAINHLA